MTVSLNVNTNDVFNQSQKFILESVEYIIHTYWNQRSGWYLSIYDSDLFNTNVSDSDEALIYGGRQIFPNQNLLSRVQDERLPKGLLICVDTDLSLTEEEDPKPSEDNFGADKRFQLWYFTEEEVQELQTS